MMSYKLETLVPNPANQRFLKQKEKKCSLFPSPTHFPFRVPKQYSLIYVMVSYPLGRIQQTNA